MATFIGIRSTLSCSRSIGRVPRRTANQAATTQTLYGLSCRAKAKTAHSTECAQS